MNTATIESILLIFLILCAISCNFTDNLLASIVIFMSYSLIMSIIWVLLESPDLAITEAAVGAGVTSLLFFVTLKRVSAIRGDEEEKPVNPASLTNPAKSADQASQPNQASQASQKSPGNRKTGDQP